MTDHTPTPLVGRLRNAGEIEDSSIMLEAADEIERLSSCLAKASSERGLAELSAFDQGRGAYEKIAAYAGRLHELLTEAMWHLVGKPMCSRESLLSAIEIALDKKPNDQRGAASDLNPDNAADSTRGPEAEGRESRRSVASEDGRDGAVPTNTALTANSLHCDHLWRAAFLGGTGAGIMEARFCEKCARVELAPYASVVPRVERFPAATEAMLQDGARAYENHLDHCGPKPRGRIEAMSAAYQAMIAAANTAPEENKHG